MLAVFLFAAVLIGSLAPEVQAQPADSAAAVATRHEDAPSLRAARLTGLLRVDGHLDETEWQAATPAVLFTQRQPTEGEPATERTEVRVLIDDHSIYFGARLHDREGHRVRSRLVRRDEDLASDYFSVLLDPYHDHSTGVFFRVSPAGSINDATIAPNTSQDFSWDPVWHVHTSMDSLGWTAEIEIPLSQLHYTEGADAVWGLQLRRWIDRKQELSEFSFTPLREQAGVSTYGHLTGLGALHSVRHLELLPYARVRSEHLDVSATDPFRDGSDQFPAAGLDLKYGLTTNLTLNGTINPDFGEVEVDPAVVNLSAFETFYPERRPFFVEGADVFRFGDMRSYNNFNTTLAFHGRRVGRAPQRTLSGDNVIHVDAPGVTTITAAAKLTGKTKSGWTLGLLDAVTPRELATYEDTVGAMHEEPVAPLTNFFVGRFKRDYRQGSTVVGGILTATHRDLADPALEGILRESAITGGFDLNHYWASRQYSFDAMVLGSTVRGREDVIAATQQSSAHYYQRPDADYVDYDPTRTRLSGVAGHASLNKIAGKHWLGSLTYQDWSPGFEINDVGFQNAADQRAFSTLALYKEDKPGKWIRNWTSFVFSNWSWNYGGAQTYEEYAAHVEGTWSSYWFSSLRGEWYPGNYDDKLTRGGPLAQFPAGGTIRAALNTDSRRSTRLNLSGVVAWDDAGGHLRQINTSLSLRPSTAFKVRFEPGFRKLRDMAQYVTTVEDPVATETYGSRYVFATIDQNQISLDTRLDWTFSPKLSLQLYVQPLIVAGEYSDLKELRTSATYEFDVYGKNAGTITTDPASGDATVDPDGPGPAAAFTVANPDFNFRSFRGNAVLRWEYRPGSALFLVWQQGREETASVGDFDFSRDWRALSDVPPENVLALKATYWIPL
jgi:hypothetical protein